MYICFWQLYLLLICHCTTLRYSKFESILCTSNVLYLITKTTFHVLDSLPSDYYDDSHVKHYVSQISPPHAPIHFHFAVRIIEQIFLKSFKMHLITNFLNCIAFNFARYCMMYMFKLIDPGFDLILLLRATDTLSITLLEHDHMSNHWCLNLPGSNPLSYFICTTSASMCLPCFQNKYALPIVCEVTHHLCLLAIYCIL